ncbi:MAG: DUF1993 family protein [Alphaproteobacteria bacterium]|nr:DUF1993 family protein [Alphaproteobacteria bacterium]
MTPTPYRLSVETFVPMLRNLASYLDKAEEYAETRKFDTAVLAGARLAPDMFPLVKQIEIATDMAKDAAARLAGRDIVKFDPPEASFASMKARIARTIDYLESLLVSDFEGGEARGVSFPLIENYVFEADGFHYLRDWTLPHFYFHVVTAYDILRHNGVPLGKRDYLAEVAGPHIHE